MKRQFFFSLLLLLPLCLMAKEVSVASPSGKLVVNVKDDGGLATYSITLDGQTMLLPSRLGFRADFGDFSQGLRIVEEQTGTASGEWQMRQVKQSLITFEANTLSVTFENPQKLQMEVCGINKKYKLGYDNPKVDEFAKWIEAAGR